MKIDIKGVIVSNDDKWIYEYLEWDAVCPRDVLKQIETAEANGEQLDVYINSGGGDVFAGNEIYAALRAYRGGVKIHVVGCAASAASVIMCAGYSDIIPSALVMVHNVSGRASGDHHAMEHAGETLRTANKAIAAAYTAKTGRTEAEILAMMDAETWLTAAQAVQMGLVNEIAGEALQLTAFAGEMLSRTTIAKLKNMIDRPPLPADVLYYAKQSQARLDYLKLEVKTK